MSADLNPHNLLDALDEALGALDPLNPRTLPDGSRWADAMALKLVCEHVARGL